MTKFVFHIQPRGAARANGKSHFTNKAVKEYYDYRTKLQQMMKDQKFVMPENDFLIRIYMPMPASWSKKKRALMCGMPDKQKPDDDNFYKAIKDAYFYKKRKKVLGKTVIDKFNTINGDERDDCCVWQSVIEKYWSEEGRIEIYTNIGLSYTLD